MSAVKINLYFELVNQFPLIPIKNKEHHTRAVNFMSHIMDLEEETKSKAEKQNVIDYSNSLTLLIKDWENKQTKVKPSFKPVDVLKFLMEQNELEQSDFEVELGNQPTVSKILNGHQELKVNQIEALAKRFKIYPAAFFPSNNS